MSGALLAATWALAAAVRNGTLPASTAETFRNERRETFGDMQFSLPNKLKSTRLWLRGGALLLHDFGFIVIQRGHQILYGFLHPRTLVLLQWDLDLAPTLEMDVVMLQGQ